MYGVCVVCGICMSVICVYMCVVCVDGRCMGVVCVCCGAYVCMCVMCVCMCVVCVDGGVCMCVVCVVFVWCEAYICVCMCVTCVYMCVVCVDGRGVCVCVCVVCVTHWLTSSLSSRGTASLPVPVQAVHPLHHHPQGRRGHQPLIQPTLFGHLPRNGFPSIIDFALRKPGVCLSFKLRYN